MAAGRMVIAGWMPALDANGLPIPNAQMYFYLNETTTLATVYADEALSVPLANPVLANSSGQFPPIWADDANRFSVTIDAPYGPPGQPFSFDNISPSTSASIPENGADRRIGPWNAETNDPILTAGVGVEGQYYVVSVEGYRNVEPNPVPGDTVFWAIDDRIQFSNGAWVRVPAGVSDVITYEDGAVEKRRAVTDKLRDIISAIDAPNFEFGKAVDQRANIEALIADRADDGRPVELPAGQIYLTGLEVPQGVTLRGASARPGEENVNRDYSRYGTVIWLDPGDDGLNTIDLNSIGAIEDVAILNPRLEYVVMTGNTPNLTLNQVMGIDPITTGPNAGELAGVAQFAGTAITNRGNDTRVRNVLIIGFENAYVSGPEPTLPFGIGPSRMVLEDVFFDCTNGIDISDCYDVPRLFRVHGWNFFTGHMGYPWQAVKRDGIAFNFHDRCDGMQITNCFGIGWKNTYRFKDMYACHMVGCTGDSLVEIGAVDPNSIGLLTEGEVTGLHMQGVRCDGNAKNFVFNHTAGWVDGQIQSGTTANGRFVEFGPNCNGGALGISVAGTATSGIHIGNDARNLIIRYLVAYYVGAGVSEIITYGNDAARKNTQVGFVKLEQGGAGTYTGGYRIGDILRVGTHLDRFVEMRGTVDTPVQVAAGGLSPAGIDIEASGTLPDVSAVNLTRRVASGTPGVTIRQPLARFDAGEGFTPPDVLFRMSAFNQIDMIAEGANPDIGIKVYPKGAGFYDVNGQARIGTDQTNFVRVSGAADGADVGVNASGASTNIGMAINAKGSGSVSLRTFNSLAARFFKTAADSASLLFWGNSTTETIIQPEGAQANIKLNLSGKGTGGMKINVASAANDAGAAAAGVSVGDLYFDASGVLRRRLT